MQMALSDTATVGAQVLAFKFLVQDMFSPLPPRRGKLPLEKLRKYRKSRESYSEVNGDRGIGEPGAAERPW